MQLFKDLHWRAHGAEHTEGKDALLDNDDLRPLKLQDRTWSTVTYFVFWWSATGTVSSWYGASAGQALGLSMWESVACILGGNILIAIVICFNGRAGAVYHVGYPILSRAAFGVYGAWWPTFNRAVMAIVWNGVNMVQGGQCVYVMLHAIFPGIARIPNKMGPGSALTSAGMIGIVIFGLATACFLVIPIPKMRLLVHIKLAVFVISSFTMLGWCVSKGGGIGNVVTQGSTVHGNEKVWLIIRFIMLGASNCATFASNASDFQRYASKPNSVIAGNLFGFPMSGLVINIIGNMVCASSQRMFGELVWNPLTLLDMIQTADYTPANRAGCFFIAAMFVFCAVISSIFENSISAGNDLAALFPKFITIRRGMFLCQIIGFAINPWYLLGSASVFVTFLGSYQIFLSSITGVLLCNYYLVAKGYLEIPDLYTASKSGSYHYYHGWNIRAYVAYVCGIAPNFYGFLNNMGVAAPLGVTRFYYFAYWFGIAVAGGVYYALCYIWPIPVQYEIKESWKEVKNYIRPEEEDVIDGIDMSTPDVENIQVLVDEQKK